ncbi:MAG: hypothetical protein IPH53_22885 [Flavobacteriales bacterium]|nr:hypothetical protein [Flavobacteriales bacterium]
MEVPAGQGIYVWIDYNGDGIKDLNEFETASFGYEANYIRVYTQTNEFIRTYSSQLSASVDLRPATVWVDKDGFRGFLARIIDLASLRADRKTADDDLGSALNPFNTDPTDTSLLSYTSSFRNTLFFNRTSRAWGIDHTGKPSQPYPAGQRLRGPQQPIATVAHPCERIAHLDAWKARRGALPPVATCRVAQLQRVQTGYQTAHHVAAEYAIPRGTCLQAHGKAQRDRVR